MTTLTDAEALRMATSATKADPLVLTVTGNSMLPFLANGRDRVFLCGELPSLRPGTIILYERPGGKAVLHRVVKVRGETLVCMGDAQDREELVQPSQVRAFAFACERKGEYLTEDSALWRVFAQGWRRIPHMRQRLIAIASKRK